jgi:hypothetical protein
MSVAWTVNLIHPCKPLALESLLLELGGNCLTDASSPHYTPCRSSGGSSSNSEDRRSITALELVSLHLLGHLESSRQL